jgi:hypothetical protein
VRALKMKKSSPPLLQGLDLSKLWHIIRVPLAIIKRR